jgi:CBS domain containing-hemolysin-like protein
VGLVTSEVVLEKFVGTIHDDEKTVARGEDGWVVSDSASIDDLLETIRHRE